MVEINDMLDQIHTHIAKTEQVSDHFRLLVQVLSSRQTGSIRSGKARYPT